jgi:hypothetical protein
LAGDDEEPFPVVGKAKVMRRNQAVPATADVFSAANVISESGQTSLHDLPGSTAIMAFEVPDVLKQHVSRAMRLQYFHDFVEQRASRLVGPAPLIARLRERLARKTSAEDVVRRDMEFFGSDISVDPLPTFREVLRVERPEAGIDLRSKDALVAECLQR